MKRLSEWPLFQPAHVVLVEGEEAFVRRLAFLGIHKGEVVEVVGAAPFSGPILVSAKGAVTAMRRGEAACVTVQGL